ncbi:C2 domain-containing protein [Baffinella frigidus]|nr:C2 domain-containing protein [Cryptophyta sp. CCMP2293]
MPTRVFINIIQARSLPVMDRATGLCDAYVKPVLKGVNFEPKETQISRKTLNPVWNEQFKCDVTDDCLLQDEPLQFRLFDYDVLSADDIIGTVYVHCNSLYEAGELLPAGGGGQKDKARRRQIQGWFPVYDTMRGICGELQLTIYIQHIMDFNPVEDSAVGVKVLSSSVPPENYFVSELFGLVDELLVEDDPEYNWQDSFRSSRSSNDARQLLFLVMDGKLRRQIGRKVTDSGGNALLAYQTHFDLEDNFIVARGIGTCVCLSPILPYTSAPGLPVPPETSAVARSYVDLSSNLSNIQSLPQHAHSRDMRDALPHAALPARRSSMGDAPAPLLGPAPPGQQPLAIEPAVTRADSSNTLQQTHALSQTHSLSPIVAKAWSKEEEGKELEKELEPLPQAQLRMLHRSKRDHFRAALRLQEGCCGTSGGWLLLGV